MKYSLASAAALLQLAAASHFTNSSSPATTITKKPSGTGVSPSVTTITEVVDTVVTYCPAPTVLTLGHDKTYTVTAPGTVTIKDCPCTLSKAVSTEVVTAYTTYCPHPTTITQGTQEYTMTAPGVATITNCPCTLTHPIATPAPTSPAQAPPAAPPAPPAAAPAAPAGSACPVCPSCPAAQTVTVTVGPNGVPVAPSGPAAPPSGPAPSGPAAPPSGPAPSGPAPSGPASAPSMTSGPAPVPTAPGPVSPPPGTTVVPPPQSPSPVVPPMPKNTTTPSGKVCPLTLAGAEYQYPHLIVEAANPNGVFSSTSYNATVSPGQSAYLNFDIPASYAGKTCEIIFALPTQAQLETSSFSLSGSGPLNFGRLGKPAVSGQPTSNTTVSALGSWNPVPGNAFKVATNACKAGSTVGYKISSPSVSLEYFQDYNPCPIGLYVVAH